MKPPCSCETGIQTNLSSIPAGLSWLPRQIGTFASFRQAMLASARSQPILAAWKARGDQDFAMMLLEMWAYVSDVQAFYDEVIANECYLATAQQRTSVKKQIALLGHQPRPAVAATLPLVVECDGLSPVALPPAFAVMSSAFDGHPPQIFESYNSAALLPQNNRWSLKIPRPQTLVKDGTSQEVEFSTLLLKQDTTLREQDIALVVAGTKQQSCRVVKVEDYVAADTNTYKQVTFKPSLKLPGNTNPSIIEVYQGTQTDGLWKGDVNALFDPSLPNSGLDRLPVFGKTIVLDGINRSIQPENTIVLHKEEKFTVYQVESSRDLWMTQRAARTITDPNDKNKSVLVPPVEVLASQLTLNKNLTGEWKSPEANSITLSYQWVLAGQGTAAAQTELAGDDALIVDTPLGGPRYDLVDWKFAIVDRLGNGRVVTGSLDGDTGSITLGQGEPIDPPIALPATIYGNVLSATRGETISNEVLGSGDATQVYQSFVLQRSPLTYLPTPEKTETQGVTSTLSIKVDQIPWYEVPTFYGAGPDDRIYTVQQTDSGESVVTFGDGVRGARLPNGTNNVIATYRIGGGEHAPPRQGVTQLLSSAKGVRNVFNPIAGSGGADPEATLDLRTVAPRSTLLLGRAISLQDVEAVVAEQSGVQAFQVLWKWSPKQQRPVVQVFVVGSLEVREEVRKALQRLTSSDTPIDVTPAQPIAHSFYFDIKVESSISEDEVFEEIRNLLVGPETGLLTPEQLGIGRSLVRSQLIESLMNVPGVYAVQRIGTEALMSHLELTKFFGNNLPSGLGALSPVMFEPPPLQPGQFFNPLAKTTGKQVSLAGQSLVPPAPVIITPLPTVFVIPDGQFLDLSRTAVWINGRNA